MEIKKIVVCGAGTMGNGIAHVFALNGFKVQLYDLDEKKVHNGLRNIETNLERQCKKEIITQEQRELTLKNIELLTELTKIDKQSELVIEAIYENKQVKLNLFNELNNIINESSIFASNTSSISITELAQNIRPAKFVGMHFMNPVPIMKLVEIIRGYSTSDETYETIFSLTKRLGKEPVTVNDYPGFISNRVLMPLINEAIFALYETVATKEDIDTVMRLGMNHPMGPLQLADFIGLDVCLDILNVLYYGFNDNKYRACPLLKKMVAAGKLGRKTGEGFYKY